VTTASAVKEHPDRVAALAHSGAVLVSGSGDLREDVSRLLPFDISTLLLEGGATLHAAAWRAGLIDSVHVVAAPRVLGAAGVRMFGDVELPASSLRPISIEMLDPDCWMEADVYRDH
jgi:riboflavin biosynthesis pyrimidine reductase